MSYRYDIEENPLQVDIELNSFFLFPEELEIRVSKNEIEKFVNSIQIAGKEDATQIEIAKKDIFVPKIISKVIASDKYLKKILSKFQRKKQTFLKKLKNSYFQMNCWNEEKLVKEFLNILDSYKRLNAYFYFVDLISEFYAREMYSFVFNLLKRLEKHENIETLAFYFTNYLLVVPSRFRKNEYIKLSPRHFKNLEAYYVKTKKANSKSFQKRSEIRKLIISKMNSKEKQKFLKIERVIKSVLPRRMENYRVQTEFWIVFKKILTTMQKKNIVKKDLFKIHKEKELWEEIMKNLR